MSYDPTGPFTNGAAPGIDASFLNEVERSLQEDFAPVTEATVLAGANDNNAVALTDTLTTVISADLTIPSDWGSWSLSLSWSGQVESDVGDFSTEDRDVTTFLFVDYPSGATTEGNGLTGRHLAAGRKAARAQSSHLGPFTTTGTHTARLSARTEGASDYYALKYQGLTALAVRES